MPLLPNTHTAERGVAFHNPSTSYHTSQSSGEIISQANPTLPASSQGKSGLTLFALYNTSSQVFFFFQNKTHEINRVFCLVGRTGFEPVKAQGRLIYSQMRLTASLPTHDSWSRCAGSNRRPSPYHGDALPTELQRQVKYYLLY